MTDEERTPPKRVRFTKLQEAQLPTIVRLEQETSAMYYEIGFDAAEVPARIASEISALPRQHSVIVAEADHEVAGYAAWRDEAPGVAYVEEIGVLPEYQRFGVGRLLIEKIREEAREYRIGEIVLKCWERASWAAAFYKRLGFVPIDEAAPQKVQTWFATKNDGRPLLRQGEQALWATVGPAPHAEEFDEEEPDETA